MASVDPTYRAALNAVGFDPKDVSAVTPNITIDVEGAATATDIASALSQTATFVITSGSGGANPFVHPVSSPSVVVTVSGTWSNDSDLAAALNDTSTCVTTAGARTAGQPFEDVDTAFQRVSTGRIYQNSHRT